MKFLVLAVLATFALSASAQFINPLVPFPVMPGEPTCCCFQHPLGSPCIDGWPTRYCTGAITPWKVCRTNAPTTTRAPTTRRPTPVPPTRRPTPEPTPGPVCDCIFDPKLPPLPAFPVDICEGINSHRCVCVGCDYTWRRQECVEWVQFDITQDTFWSRDRTYLIKGEIHVCSPARLTIEPGTVVIFEDWPVSILQDGSFPFPRPPHTTSVWSVLVVDTGASIDAENVSFEGKSREANQLAAGLVILGNGATITHPLYATIQSTFSNRPSAGRQSRLNRVRLVNLGQMGSRLGSLSLIATDNSDVYLDHIFVGNPGATGVYTWANRADFHGLTVTRALRNALRAEAGSDFQVNTHLQLEGRTAYSIEVGSSVEVQAGTYWNRIDSTTNSQSTTTIRTFL